MQSLFYLNPKFQASSHLVWLYSPVCVGPGRKPRRPVFSQRGSTKKVICHICCWQTIQCAIERIIATLTFSIAHLSSNKKAQIAILRAQFYKTILFCLINGASQDINHPRLKVRKFLILQWCIQYRKASFCSFSCIHNIDSFALVYVLQTYASVSPPKTYHIYIFSNRKNCL